MGDIGTKVIQVPFRGGVNTGADKRTVEAPALTWAQNVVLDTDGVLKKRKGYAALSNDDPRTSTVFNRCDALTAYEGGLAAVAGEGAVWHRVAASNHLIRAESGFAPVARVVRRRAIARNAESVGITRTDIAYESTSGILVASYMVAATTAKAAIMDATTGHVRFLEGNKADVQRVRMLTVGTRFYWILPSSISGDINMYFMSASSPVNLNSHANGGVPQFIDYDFATGAIGVSAFSSTQFFIAYARAASIQVAKCSLFGTAVATATIAETATGPIACRYVGTLLWVAWQVAGGNIRMVAYDAATMAVSVPAFTVLAGAAQAFTLQIGARDASSVLLAWDNGTTCRVRAISTAGVLLFTEREFVADHIESGFFEVDGRSFIMLAEPSSLQGGTFLVDVTVTSSVIFNSCVTSAAIAHLTSGALSTAPVGDTICSVVQRSDGVYMWGGIIKTKVTIEGGALFTYATANLGADLFEFDLTSGKRFRAVEHGGELVFAGGTVTVFDGRELCDVGFLTFPETPVNNGTLNAGGFMEPGTYQYCVTYRRDDMLGRVWRSNPSQPLSVVIPAGTNTNRQSVLCGFAHFIRQTGGSDAGVRLEFWRTEKDSAGPFYFVGSEDNLPNASSLGGISDTLADATINTRETLYTDGGVLANFPPPPATFVVSHGDVLICDNAEDGSLWQSKPHVVGEGFSFSEALTCRIASSEKPVAGASMDDKCVVFTENEIHLLLGQPKDDKGVGAGFEPQKLPSSVGCIDPRSVVVGKDGVYFRSRRGIELLTRGLEVVNIGFDVTYWTDNYTDTLFAEVCPKSSEVRFCVAAPVPGVAEDHQILRLNTERKSQTNPFGMWTTELVGMGVPRAGSIASGLITLGYSDGRLFQESETLFTDDGDFVPRTVRMMLKPAGQQGFVRLRRLTLLADRKSSHKLTIFMRYNYEDAIRSQRAWANAEISGLPREQLPMLMDIQKAQAFEVEIQDSEDTVGPGPDTGEGCTFVSVAMELGVIERVFSRYMPQSAKK
jgi:hypothetical protein